MKRILHIVSALNGGGVENLLLNYFKYINKDSFIFDFIVFGKEKGINEYKLEEMGSTIYHIPPRRKDLFSSLKQMKKIIYTGKYDIVHAHQNHLSFIPLYYAKKCGINKRISHSHTVFVSHNLFKRLFHKIGAFFTKHYATNLFSCGFDAGQSLFGIKAMKTNKVFIMKNAIDIDKFAFNDNMRKEIRKELGVENELIIGHVGRMTYEKNHVFLLMIFSEIYKKNQNTKLLLIGGGVLEEEIRNQVKYLNMEDAVIFLGLRNDVYKFYQAMDVFVLPSLYEGVPVVSIEAQDAGCKCFFSDSITQEVKLLDTTEYISLNQTPSYWAQQIQKNSFSYIDRIKCSQIVQQKGYDVKNETKDLEFYYQKN